MNQEKNTAKIWEKKWENLDAETFEKNALEFDGWTIHHKSIIEKYASQIPPQGIFLEAGCGMGYWCFYVSEKYNIRSVGVDIAEKTISRLQKKSTELISFSLDDLNNSSLKSNSFDMFISLGVIEHFKDSNPMVKNLERILKPGGIGLITVPNLFSVHTITRPILELMGKWDIGYEKSFSPKKLKRLVENNGLDIVEYGTLPSGEMFGLFLNNLPLIGKFFRKLSFFIEKKQDTLGFISYVVVRKK